MAPEGMGLLLELLVEFLVEGVCPDMPPMIKLAPRARQNGAPHAIRLWFNQQDCVMQLAITVGRLEARPRTRRGAEELDGLRFGAEHGRHGHSGHDARAAGVRAVSIYTPETS